MESAFDNVWPCGWVGSYRLDSSPPSVHGFWELNNIYFYNRTCCKLFTVTCESETLKKASNVFIMPRKSQSARSKLQNRNCKHLAWCLGYTEGKDSLFVWTFPATMLVIKFYCYLNDESGAWQLRQCKKMSGKLWGDDGSRVIFCKNLMQEVV